MILGIVRSSNVSLPIIFVKTEVQKLHQCAADEHCLLSGGQFPILPPAGNASY